MAAVHLGTMVGPAGERRVAIKQLVAEDALDERARERLIEEARLVFRLTHANICQVFDLASNSDGTFVVMELVDGLDLRMLVKRAGPLELPHALYVAREVARALDYAHRRTDEEGRPLLLVHGDVTPANVLLSCEGEVKLADFGIARALGRAPDRERGLAGTKGFIAPELKTHATSQRADLYALGVTLYVALTGLYPSDAGFAPRALRRVRPEASAELERLVARATADDPGARVASAAQLEEELAIELARQFAGFTPSSLARVVRAHQEQAQIGAGAEPPPSEAVLASMTAATVDALPPRRPSELALAPKPVPAPAETLTLPPPGTATAPAERPRRWPWLIATALAVAGIAAYLVWPRGATEQAASVTSAPTPAPSAAPQQVVAAPPSAPPAAPQQVVSAAPPVVRAAPRARSDRMAHPAPAPPAPAPSAAAAPSAAPGYLTVTARAWGAVYVDGKQVAAQTPLYRHPLPAGVHRIKIFQPSTGDYSAEQQAVVRAGETAALSFK